MKYSLEEIVWPQTPFPLKPNLILAGLRGSEAHGTYIPPDDPNSIDDIDVMGVVIPPIKYYFGTSKWDHCEQIDAPWDVIIDEFKKYISLLVKQNPNVIASLWLEPEDYIYIHPIGQILIDNRNLFASRDVYKQFIGYSKAQLTRMTHISHRGYLGAKRKKLVEKYGYDCKNSGHVVRLLLMAAEFLETGTLKVRRTIDRDLIMSIKRGEWKLEKIYALAADLFTKCEESYKASVLPTHLDLKAIDLFCVQLLQEWFSKYAK